jgi:hypothetical protein
LTFRTESAQAQDSFYATIIGELRQHVSQLVRQILMEAKIISSDGTRHESLKGEPGPQGIPGATGATGPQGGVGPAGATGPQGPHNDITLENADLRNLILSVLREARYSPLLVGPRGAPGQAWYTSWHDEKTAIQAIVDKVLAALKEQHV